ncbi:AEC family transporter [Seohaeicola saemankumensis]|uniref:AEC family transporter n=1 Tax=Seohaeicola saemankumensis TaxID=481181 RepID=A0ABW3TFE6_9RHOB
MGAILTITFPIFALIGIGYGAVRAGLFAASDMKTLGKYVLNIALPALLFNTVATRDLNEVLNLGYVVVFALAGLLTIGVTYLWFTLQGTGPARRAIAVMGSTCPNSGFVGYPVMLLVFPDLAGVVLALNMVVENFLLIPLCLIFLEASRDRHGKSLLRIAGGIILGVLRRPMVIGLMLGLLVMLSGLPVPQMITRLMEVLATSSSAIALFVIGGSLVGLPVVGQRSLAAQIVAGKLLVSPAMAGLVLLTLPLIGLPLLSGDMAVAVVLSMAMPMFGIYTLLAQDYGHEGIASIALLGATAGAFFTLSALLAILT